MSQPVSQSNAEIILEEIRKVLRLKLAPTPDLELLLDLFIAIERARNGSKTE